MSTELRYRVVDVFTDASALDALTMRRILRELNLAETAFILPPTLTDCTA
jgi:predicted PhzF superfamily epimerase YddE/YHI9